LLATAYVRQNKLAEATVEFEKLVALQPRSVAYITMVGTLLHLQNKIDDAKKQYEKALSIDSQAPVAANNLAQLYSDKNENLDIALQLAKTAKAGLPSAHEINDTLGWLYYKKGQAALAVSTLQSAVSAQPNNPVYLYHLGAAYALNNDKPNARQALEKALSLGRFDGADDAKKVLDSLK
jgi:Flp pilus assembly protein TadD